MKQIRNLLYSQYIFSKNKLQYMFSEINYSQLEALIKQTNRSIFVNIQVPRLQAQVNRGLNEMLANKKSIILAPTGISSIYFRCQTIHKFFSIPIADGIIDLSNVVIEQFDS